MRRSITGAACEWSTEPAPVIPRVNYPEGYTEVDYYRYHARSGDDCVIGSSWLPMLHGHPLSGILVPTEEFNSFSATQQWCTGLADPACEAKDWGLAVANLALGYCDADSGYNCIEALEVIAPDGTEQQARYLRGFPALAEVPEFREGDAFVPTGGSVPLWEFDGPGGPVRLLSPGKTEKMFIPEGGRWPTRPGALFKLWLQPVTIDPRSSLPKPEQESYVDARTGVQRVQWGGWDDPDAAGCVATDAGECTLEARFPEGYRYRLALRLRDEASLYLNGSIDNPVAYSTKLSGGHRNWDMDTHANSGQPLGRGALEPLAWLKALLPYFGDRASFVADARYVGNTPTQGRDTSQCVDQGKGEFIGIVSSNSTAYTGDPPVYNQATNTLSYDIAGPHYMPDGTTTCLTARRCRRAGTPST